MFRSILIVVLGSLLFVSGCARSNHSKFKVKSSPTTAVASSRDEAPLADMNADVAAYVDPARAKKSAKSPSAAIELNEVIAIMGSDKSAKRSFANDDVVSISRSKPSQQPTIDRDSENAELLGNRVSMIPTPSRTIKRMNAPRLYTFGPTKAGAALAEIAEKLLPSDEVTISQMMWALYKKNPDAFVKKNINNVKANAVLNVPEFDEVMAISRKEADAQITRLRGTTNTQTNISSAL